MRRIILLSIAVVTALSMTAGEVIAACKPIPPADVSGHIEVAPPGGASFTLQYFEQNGCDWGGFDQLNGFDGLILDVDGMGGTKGTLTATMGTGTFLVTAEGYFLGEDCSSLGESGIAQTTDGEPYSVEIPEGAKWLAVFTSTQLPSRDVTIDLHSDGKVCKKKKKKKRR